VIRRLLHWTSKFRAQFFRDSARAAKKVITYLKNEGCIIIHKCTTIRHAKVRASRPYFVLVCLMLIIAT